MEHEGPKPFLNYKTVPRGCERKKAVFNDDHAPVIIVGYAVPFS